MAAPVGSGDTRRSTDNTSTEAGGLSGETMELLLAYADDELRLMLKHVLAALLDDDVEIVESGDGVETSQILLSARCPEIALVDWDLPEGSGPELCRQIRARHQAGPPYIILLALREHPLAEGLNAGADDCVRLPIPGDELMARIRVGRRFAALPWERLNTTGSVWVTRPRPLASAEPRVSAVRQGETDQGDSVRGASELVAHGTTEDDGFTYGLEAGSRPGRSALALQAVIVAQ